jgi:hypothetical protein
MYLLLEFFIDILEDDMKLGYKQLPSWNFVLISMICHFNIEDLFQKSSLIRVLVKMNTLLKNLVLPNSDRIQLLIHRLLRLVSNQTMFILE